jgi:uncharacterized protein YdhG (YjbR/CyaY superfamily)
MKKSVSRSDKIRARSGTAQKTVDDYLSRLPEPARTTLNKIRATIRAAVPPDAEEVISYGIPAFKYKKVLVWYAAFKDHCSFFPTNAVIEEFKEELTRYHLSKGTVQFPVDKPLPAALLKKMVKARLAEVEGKQM